MTQKSLNLDYKDSKLSLFVVTIRSWEFIRVNSNVTDMNKITDNNSVNAEKSSTASENLSIQAKQMSSYVVKLLGLIIGNSKTSISECISIEDSPDKLVDCVNTLDGLNIKSLDTRNNNAA
ncbi:hypothetical protein QUF76_07030 [Desulfobacterales bacterium HSG16]|nr:hypothetical protein [Desulfobacterales bacterium HSG16]